MNDNITTLLKVTKTHGEGGRKSSKLYAKYPGIFYYAATS